MLKFITGKKKSLQGVDSHGGGWWPVVKEAFAGAWQCNVEVRRELVQAYFAVFACQTLIASDIAKMRLRMMRREGGIWEEDNRPGFEVLDKPNHYQNRIQFFESWMHSRLSRGNAYIFLERNNKGKVVSMHVLHPDRVIPKVTPSGSVFYQLGADNLADIQNQIIVPASEIIHDRYNTLFHPLCGLSPIFASGLAATQGLEIQNNSAIFFKNKALPSGILIAPGELTEENAKLIKSQWENNYSAEKAGRTAVISDGMKYQQMSVNAADAQTIEQLKMTADIICSTYHVPAYKVIGTAPSHNNIEAQEQQYHSQCLQSHMESIELCLDEALGLENNPIRGVEFDLEGLLRMDTLTQTNVVTKLSEKGILKINEARAKFGLKPITGGDAAYLQQQNYSLEALSKRDNKENPFAKEKTAPAAPIAPAPANDDTKQFFIEFSKALGASQQL